MTKLSSPNNPGRPSGLKVQLNVPQLNPPSVDCQSPVMHPIGEPENPTKLEEADSGRVTHTFETLAMLDRFGKLL